MTIRTLGARRRARLPGVVVVATALVALATPAGAQAATAPKARPAPKAAPAAQIAPAPDVLYTWGWGNYGQLGDGTTALHPYPEPITLAAGVTPTALADGGDYSLAIGSDHRLYAWGDNDGQLGDGTQTERDRPVAVTLAAGVSPTAISAGGDNYGYGFSLAVGSDHRLYSWGDNEYGQLGNGHTNSYYSPEAVDLVSGVTPVAIAAGADFGLAIGSDHQLYTWGANYGGALGDGTTAPHLGPEVLALAAGVTPVAVSADGQSAAAIGSDGRLYTWGNDYLGSVPQAVPFPAGVTATAVADGDDDFLAIGSDHQLYSWGYNSQGQLGDGTVASHVNPRVVALSPGVAPVSVAAADSMSVAVGSDHRVYVWGLDAPGGGSATPEPINIVNPSVVAAGYFEHYMAIGTALLPVVTGLSPPSGPTGGGTVVTVAGDDFNGATSVRFGTVAATSFHVLSDTALTAVAPPQADSVHNVYVTTPVGTSAAGPLDEFASGADVAGIAPTIGTTGGGTTVTLTGVGFTGATAVSFGAVPATSFTVVSGTEITAVSPPQAAGAHNVHVTTAAGVTPAGPGDIFTYGVIVTDIFQNNGTARGGTRITITGSDLSGATNVLFGTVPATTFRVVSDTEIAAVSPAQPVGIHNVYVTTPAGTSAPVAADLFTYEVVVSALSPTTGPAAGGTTVTITGSDLTGATNVLFGNVPATSFTVDSDNAVTAVSPPEPPGSDPVHNITVVTPAGTTTEVPADLFTYE